MKLSGQRRFVAYTTRDIGLSTETKTTEWIVYDKQEEQMVEEFGKLVGKGARQTQMDNAKQMNKLTVAEVKDYAMANYDKGGDQIIECWEDSEIQEWVEEDGTLKGLKKSIRDGERIRQDIVNA